MGHSAGADGSCSDILSLLRDRAAAHPERPAIEEADGEVLTYVALLARTEGLAAALRLRVAGRQGGSRVGIVLPNGLPMSQALLAVTCVGAAPSLCTTAACNLTTHTCETHQKACVAPDACTVSACNPDTGDCESTPVPPATLVSARRSA